MLKKAYDISALTPTERKNMDSSPLQISLNRRGTQGDNLIEPIPNYHGRISDSIYEGSNNTSIVLGRDRPGEVGSGYGNETGAGTIDIVVGRVSNDIQPSRFNRQSTKKDSLFVDPNLAKDASRIYISQKTDADANFALKPGGTGSSKGKAAIVIKSDAVRIIGREGVKIVSRVDSKNSHGGKIITIPPIELIANNNPKNLSPLTRQDPLDKALKDIIKRVDELNSYVDNFITAQMDFNGSTMEHEHPSPMLQGLGATAAFDPFLINDGKIPFSPGLCIAGMKSFGSHSIAKKDGIVTKLQLALSDINSAESFGVNHAGSNNVKAT